MDFDDTNFYKDYQERLTTLIYEKSNKEIPKEICSNFAINSINMIKYKVSCGYYKDISDIDISEYVDACIWAYYQ